MMKEEFLDSYNGYHLGLRMDPMEPPGLSLPLGDDHSDDDAICEPPQPPQKRLQARRIRRLGFGGDPK